jgi:hypothetical protein
MPEKVSFHEASSLLCANHNSAKASLHLVDNAQPPLKLLNARAGLSAFRSDVRGLLHVAPSALTLLSNGLLEVKKQCCRATSNSFVHSRRCVHFDTQSAITTNQAAIATLFQQNLGVLGENRRSLSLGTHSRDPMASPPSTLHQTSFASIRESCGHDWGASFSIRIAYMMPLAARSAKFGLDRIKRLRSSASRSRLSTLLYPLRAARIAAMLPNAFASLRLGSIGKVACVAVSVMGKQNFDHGPTILRRTH